MKMIIMLGSDDDYLDGAVDYDYEYTGYYSGGLTLVIFILEMLATFGS